MVFLFQLTPHANIRYREAQVKLGQAELACLLKGLGISAEITPCTMGGVSFLRFEAEELTEKQLVRKMRAVDRTRAQTRALLSASPWGQRHEYHLTINTTGWEIKEMVPSVAAYAEAWFRRGK
jgi:hypothetical protein